MRILFLGTDNLRRNGTTQRMLFLAKAILSLGVKVSVAIPDQKENRSFCRNYLKNTETYFFPVSNFITELYFKHNIASSGKYDIVHCFCTGIRSLLLKSRKYEQTTIIYDWDELLSQHGGISFLSRIKFRLIENYTLWGGDAFTVASEYLNRYISNRLPPKRGREIITLPNGYDFDIDKGAVTGEACKVIRDDDAEKKLIYIGRISKGYQIMELVELAIRLKELKYNWKIYIIGEGQDLRSYVQKTHDLRIKSHIKFLGRIAVEEVAGCLKCADVLLFPISPTPQNKARCPLKIYQYIASGVPIVTNNVGEVGRATSGYILTSYYDYGNVESLLQACLATFKSKNDYLNKEKDIESFSWRSRAVNYCNWANSLKKN